MVWSIKPLKNKKIGITKKKSGKKFFAAFGRELFYCAKSRFLARFRAIKMTKGDYATRNCLIWSFHQNESERKEILRKMQKSTKEVAVIQKVTLKHQ